MAVLMVDVDEDLSKVSDKLGALRNSDIVTDSEFTAYIAKALQAERDRAVPEDMRAERDRAVPEDMRDRVRRFVMFETETQPEREESDGPMAINRLNDGKWLIAVTTNGERQYIECGGYNLWRLFGTMALLLGVKLPKKVSASIKL